MIGHHFQHQLIRKHCIIFGTLFNNIYITRPGNQAFKIPIEYGPKEKYYAHVQGTPGTKNPKAIQLPRMSFEMTGMSYDTTRKINRRQVIINDQKEVVYGSPWNFNFVLNVIARNQHDVTAIVEQALTYFNPDYTIDAKLLDDFEHLTRITTVYNSVSHEDTYAGSFEERRTLAWEINFTVKSFLYGAVDDSKLIKMIDVRVHPTLNTNSANLSINITPGLTVDGEPTTDPNETIPYQLINWNDDWDYIIQTDLNEAQNE